MASNFRIYSDKIDNNRVALKLFGDFDGTSAWELIHQLKSLSKKTPFIIIDTRGLREIVPFGQDVFSLNVKALKSNSTQFFMTGKKAVLLAPNGLFSA